MFKRLKRAFFPSPEELELRKQELRRHLEERKGEKGWLTQPRLATFSDLPDAAGPIRLDSSACPHCGAVQDPPPQRRKKCRDCKGTIHIWTDREARRKYLLTEDQRQQRERERRNRQWVELSQIIQTAMQTRDWGSLEGAYRQQAAILFSEGRPHRHVAIEAARAQLMRMYEDAGIRSVRVSSSQDERVCEYCTALEGKVFDIENALEQLPIPGPHCTDGSDQNPHGGRCRCVYIAVI